MPKDLHNTGIHEAYGVVYRELGFDRLLSSRHRASAPALHHTVLARIAEAARWDGLHGVATNVRGMPVEQILQRYRGLWQVERSFRITKHDLKVRPIYHWTPRRIRAHLAIAYMAFACVRHLAYRVKLQKKRNLS